MSRPYAEHTVVPVSRSRDELERILVRFGATAQAWARDDEKGTVVLAFKRAGKGYKLVVHLVNAASFTQTPTGRERLASAAQEAAEQENRRRFRSLANFVKAMMDAADTGIISAEDALLPYLILPGGATVAQALQEQMKLAPGVVDLSRTLASRGEP